MGVENDNLLLNRSRVAGSTILIAEDVILNDDRFLGAAKFQGVVADPVDVRVLTNPTLRVFFNGSAPTFTNAVRINV